MNFEKIGPRSVDQVDWVIQSLQGQAGTIGIHNNYCGVAGGGWGKKGGVCCLELGLEEVRVRRLLLV